MPDKPATHDTNQNRLQKAINTLNDQVDGFGDRVSADADLARHLRDKELDPDVFGEQQSQDLFRYGINAEDFWNRFEENGIQNTETSPQKYREAIISFAKSWTGPGN